LKAIQGDATTPDVTPSGDVLFSKAVVDAIDVADSEARTDAETRLSKVLSALLMRHSTNNMQMEETEHFAKLTHNYTSTSEGAQEIETMNFLPNDPKVVALKNSPEFQKEEECAEGLEGLFRARKSGPIPEACTAMDAK
jgi:hypothetical protein